MGNQKLLIAYQARNSGGKWLIHGSVRYPRVPTRSRLKLGLKSLEIGREKNNRHCLHDRCIVWM